MMEFILQALAAGLKNLGSFDLNDCFIDDESSVPAKKYAVDLELLGRTKVLKAWQVRLALVFSLPLA